MHLLNYMCSHSEQVFIQFADTYTQYQCPFHTLSHYANSALHHYYVIIKVCLQFESVTITKYSSIY